MSERYLAVHSERTGHRAAAVTSTSAPRRQRPLAKKRLVARGCFRLLRFLPFVELREALSAS